MATLNEIKEFVAMTFYGFDSWEHIKKHTFEYSKCEPPAEFDEMINEIAKLYAKSKLEEAAERAEVYYEWQSEDFKNYKVDKDSIINTPLD